MVLSIKSTCAKGGVLCNGFKYKTIVQQVAAKVLCNAFKYKIIVPERAKVLLRRCGGEGGGVHQHHYLFTRGYALLLELLEDVLLVVGVPQSLLVELGIIPLVLLLLLPALLYTKLALVLLHVCAHFVGLVPLPLALRHCWIGGFGEK